MIRESGYYWVKCKDDGGWRIELYYVIEWYMIANTRCRLEDEFIEVGERVMCPYHKKAM